MRRVCRCSFLGLLFGPVEIRWISVDFAGPNITEIRSGRPLSALSPFSWCFTLRSCGRSRSVVAEVFSLGLSSIRGRCSARRRRGFFPVRRRRGFVSSRLGTQALTGTSLPDNQRNRLRLGLRRRAKDQNALGLYAQRVTPQVCQGHD